MNDERRARLANLIEPLQSLSEFSASEAKRHCRQSSPGYVTRTLSALVNDGVLLRIDDARESRFRWSNPPGEFHPEKWIDRQIHGLQVKETPAEERPRERLMRQGAAALSDAELLAILIRVGVPKESAVVGGSRIANRFAGSLDQLPRCAANDLKSISPAATAASYAQIMAGIELGRRVAASESQTEEAPTKITTTREAIDYCQRVFARLALDAVQEEFHIVTLDTKHKPIQTHRVTVGTLDASLVHPREVFRPAIRDAASAVLLVHNHPSGDPTPSKEDRQVTDQLTEAGKLLGITVLDHIVVAKQRSISIREFG